MIKKNTGVRQVLGKVVKKRRRQSTPVEHLDDVREEKFKAEEARAEKRARKEDKAWETVMTSAKKTHQNNPTMAAIADQMQRERYCPC
jgi:hypothetical protein